MSVVGTGDIKNALEIDSGILVSVVVVTSPSPIHPATTMVDAVLHSTWKMLKGSIFRTVIVLDGYKIEPQSRTKKGKVTKEIADNYELYHNNLVEKYGHKSNTHIVRCSRHVGFAYAVKIGLEYCKTTYAFVLQHDRVFLKVFSPISCLIDIMEKHPHLRYIGFPSIMNCNHEIILKSKYDLDILTTSTYKLQLNENFSLLPLIFWYDSNHFCHVQRYLEIYRPYTYIPIEIQSQIKENNPHENILKKMLLKYGDFIEDRFGQIQRNLLVGSNQSQELLSTLFHWYGSYLIWPTLSSARGNLYERIFVSHLRGRKFRPEDTIRYFDDVRNRSPVDEEDELPVEVGESEEDESARAGVSDELFCAILATRSSANPPSSSSSSGSSHDNIFASTDPLELSSVLVGSESDDTG